MTAFIFLASLIALATIAWLAWPFLRSRAERTSSADEVNAAVYRDQLLELDLALAQGTVSAAEHRASSDAIRRRLLDDLQRTAAPDRAAMKGRSLPLAVTLALVPLAAILYFVLGTPGAIGPAPSKPAAAAANSSHSLQSTDIAGMVERLAVRLKENPEDVNGWVMLARSQGALGRFDDASRSYGEAAKRAPSNAGLLADYADTLAMARGKRFEGEPDRIVQRALEIDPRHVKSLALAGSSAFQRKDYAAAVAFWTRLSAELPPESDMGRSVAASLAQARSLAAGRTPAAPARPTAGFAGVSGVVRVSAALASRVQPDDVVFVYARAGEGDRRPVAILRRTARDLPLPFQLDDSSSMSADARLSGMKSVMLEARISRTGAAAPTAGDLRATLGPVAVGARSVVLEITEVVP